MPLSSSEDSETGIEPNRIPRLLTEELSSEKHVLRIRELFEKIDSQKRIYPNGLLTKLAEDESTGGGTTVNRIELFAENKTSREVHGVVRRLFLASSSERKLIDLATFSNWVISIRALSKEKKRDGTERTVIEDRLVLKQRVDEVDQERQEMGRGTLSAESVMRGLSSIPSLYVAPRWLDRLNLKTGDRVIVSNPLENYATPPPDLGGK